MINPSFPLSGKRVNDTNSKDKFETKNNKRSTGMKSSGGSFKRLHSNSYISLPDETSYQKKSHTIDAGKLYNFAVSCCFLVQHFLIILFIFKQMDGKLLKQDQVGLNGHHLIHLWVLQMQTINQEILWIKELQKNLMKNLLLLPNQLQQQQQLARK